MEQADGTQASLLNAPGPAPRRASARRADAAAASARRAAASCAAATAVRQHARPDVKTLTATARTEPRASRPPPRSVEALSP